MPATLVFDHPNLKAVSEWVLEALELADSSRKVETAAVVRHVEATGALAIVGVGLRFPGGATDLESFWQVLSTGVDTLGPIPPERFDHTSYYDPDPEHRGTSYVKEASLLNDVAGFDAAFFGISPREAAQMDPQHRLLLEVTWSALEDAGIVPKSLAESMTGLFIGIGANEYQIRGLRLEGRGRLCSDRRRGVILCWAACLPFGSTRSGDGRGYGMFGFVSSAAPWLRALAIGTVRFGDSGRSTGGVERGIVCAVVADARAGARRPKQDVFRGC